LKEVAAEIADTNGRVFRCQLIGKVRASEENSWLILERKKPNALSPGQFH
jgi:hypothetical protein